MLLVIHLKKLHIWVHFRQLTYLGMKSFATTTTRREEIKNSKFVPSIHKGVHKVLCRGHLLHVGLQVFLPPSLSSPKSESSLSHD
uniref:Uncharacterized protein n=1 Tax=Rhizophora mucronata TaxID=61149 RepID=A0A2P2MD81_RHIMU